MTEEFASFAFVITLAAVVNGLGIVRWLNDLAAYLVHREAVEIDHYWVYTLAAVFQLLLHVVLWWSLWSLRGSTALNFVTYLYLLAGPILMFIGSAFLAPRLEGERVNLRRHYFAVRSTYSVVLILIWSWALLAGPVFRGQFPEHVAVLVMLLLVALVQRATDKEPIHRFAAIANWLLLVVFILGYGLELGGLTANPGTSG